VTSPLPGTKLKGGVSAQNYCASPRLVGLGPKSLPRHNYMKKIIITKENENRRIDKFLAKEFFSYTRGDLIRSIKEGKISVNKKNVKPSYILKENDEITLDIKEKKSGLVPNENIILKIIFENDDILILNKSAGIAVHPAIGSEKNNTVVNGLLAFLPEIKSVHDVSPGSELRPGIVHRLDKETSGVLVVAKNKKSFFELKKLFQTRHITKKYLALVYGTPENKEGIISKPLSKSANHKKQTIANQRTRNKIREAITEYKILKSIGKYSLLEVYPKTGRTHQIRIHLSSIGHPVVGDKIYGKENPLTTNTNLSTRHLLHARQIKFELFEKKYSFMAPIPKDFSEFIKKAS
jgi:23S rRNA pseudouridine1911/1915/1917 synthase